MDAIEAIIIKQMLTTPYRQQHPLNSFVSLQNNMTSSILPLWNIRNAFLSRPNLPNLNLNRTQQSNMLSNTNGVLNLVPQHLPLMGHFNVTSFARENLSLQQELTPQQQNIHELSELQVTLPSTQVLSKNYVIGRSYNNSFCLFIIK